jgi:hypothetical protein
MKVIEQYYTIDLSHYFFFNRISWQREKEVEGTYASSPDEDEGPGPSDKDGDDDM